MNLFSPKLDSDYSGRGSFAKLSFVITRQIDFY